MKKYKAGDKHPTDKTLLFHSYNKCCKGGILWATQETIDRWTGRDKHWSVYYLPVENYYGCTKRLKKRLWEHRQDGKDTSGYKVIKTFLKKEPAEKYELKLQLKHKANGYRFTEFRRKQISDYMKDQYGENGCRQKRYRPVICIETGVVYKSIKDCEQTLGIPSGSVGRHVRNPKRSVNGMQFRYFTKTIVKEMKATSIIQTPK